MSSPLKARMAMLSLMAAALASPVMLGACVRTPGAPADDYYEPESAAQAIEEEGEEDAWEDANR